jgi:hypothetical protein
MKSKSFKYWLTQEIHQEFQLNRELKHDILDEWINSTSSINDAEQMRLDELKNNLMLNAEYWNEEELKIKFIGPLLDLVKFDDEKIRVFYDRPLTAQVSGITLSGTVDMMVATGFQIPSKPFFCIHEYKQENKRDGDPKGQLLIGMIAAQAINNSENLYINKPVYGCYVLGRNWFFMVLQDKKYSVSNGFDASQEDIFQIFKMLRSIKERIFKML